MQPVSQNTAGKTYAGILFPPLSFSSFTPPPSFFADYFFQLRRTIKFDYRNNYTVSQAWQFVAASSLEPQIHGVCHVRP